MQLIASEKVHIRFSIVVLAWVHHFPICSGHVHFNWMYHSSIAFDCVSQIVGQKSPDVHRVALKLQGFQHNSLLRISHTHYYTSELFLTRFLPY